MEKEERKNKYPKCVSCGSAMTYLRIKDNERVCRACGHIDKIEIKKEGEVKE
jgi:acetyl-CoA carboxylase beta subunit